MKLSRLKQYLKIDPMESLRPRPNRGTRLNVLIFSKDRACQVDSLLRSIDDHLQHDDLRIFVLYNASGKDFDKGYAKIINKNVIKETRWLREQEFKADVSRLLLSFEDSDYVMFLVDDNIVLKEIDLNHCLAEMGPEHLFLSLRASRSYAKDAMHPVFVDKNYLLEWTWQIQKKGCTTWNYPFSVDGNIYHCIRIKQVIQDIEFSAPNSLESSMHSYRSVKWVRNISKAICPLEPVISNNPLNRVQTEGATWHKDIDPAYLNNEYLAGRMIDNTVLYCRNPTSTHTDLGLHWTEDNAELCLPSDDQYTLAHF